VTHQASATWGLDPGEHVCWQARTAREYAAGERELAVQAAHASSKLLIVGTPQGEVAGSGSVVVLDRPCRADSLLDAVHEQVDSARRSGRRLWVLAGMEHLVAPDAPLEELVARELDLAELAADSGTSVVCAYSAQQWKPSLLGDLLPVHSRAVGIKQNMAGFWLRRARTGGWTLEGNVGFESLRAFTAALRGALSRSHEVSFGCENLELIDASAWRVLVETVVDIPGSSVSFERANETVRDAWRMTGYAATGVGVQVRA
jgi:hypothetical protein